MFDLKFIIKSNIKKTNGIPPIGFKKLKYLIAISYPVKIMMKYNTKTTLLRHNANLKS